MLFQRSLMNVLNIDLWRTYLNYVREAKASLTTFKEKMAQAYDFALDKMGLDVASFSIWNEYVRFLKSVEANGSYLENQKIAAIRKVYQKGVVTPVTNIEQLWKDYTAFEQSVNPVMAEKLLGERSREYMNARRVAKEYEAVTRGLVKSAPAVPPSGSAEELKQVEVWQKYVGWEKSNPMRVEDPSLVAKRVMFAYEQCLLCLGHHPNVWHEAAVFLQETSKLLSEKGDVDKAKLILDEASTLYERATNGILKDSMILHFAQADFEEQNRKSDKVHKIYNSFIENKDIDPSLCYIQYMKYCRRCEGAASARSIFKRAREDGRCSHHVFVAAALMEYFCTKDKKIASNVFELGFKKFKNSEDYLLAYLDYLAHLNEDNNTRVLFERALTSGSLTPDNQIRIWNKFLEFEANLGDMTSIIKVEKRRAQALEQTEHGKVNETSQLIDRYKFLDLFPCKSSELRALGYKTHVSRIDDSDKLSNGQETNAEVSKSSKMIKSSQPVARPDVNQMIPFKPKVDWIPGDHRMTGGSFPMPPAAALLCQRLPPPFMFTGPFVIVDRLIEVMQRVSLPLHFDVEKDAGVGHEASLFDAAVTARPRFSSRRQRNDVNNEGSEGNKNDESKKRKGDLSDEENNDTIPTDIFRLRQQKRLK